MFPHHFVLMLNRHVYSAPARCQLPDPDQPPNIALDSGTWIDSIIWDHRTPFRDFTQLEVNVEQTAGSENARNAHAGPTKRDGTLPVIIV